MNDSPEWQGRMRSIAAVERDTGLSKDTLRMWERRYQFPAPLRDAQGERLYPNDQVEKLLVLRRLIDSGHRPGKIISLPLAALQALFGQGAHEEATTKPPGLLDVELERCLGWIRAHDPQALRREFMQLQLRVGLERFVQEVAAPLTRMVGDSWAAGSLAIFEEHLFTEVMKSSLRVALGMVPVVARGPRVLLTTIPLEQHSLGLLMAEVILALEGAVCTSLGTQMPVWDIVQAARAHQVDVVALSCSASLNPTHVVESITELREELPEAIELWVGGRCPVLQRRTIGGVCILDQLEEIPSHVQRWRQARD